MTIMMKSVAESGPLADRLRGGDVQAVADGFAHYREQLRRMVAARLDRRLSSRLSPSDILQEAYLDALKRMPHYVRKPEMTVFGWLRWIVGQRLVEVHRHHLGAQRRDASQEISLTQPDPAAGGIQSLAGFLAGSLT